MIPAYNRKQFLLSILNFVLGSVTLSLTTGFFYLATKWILHQFDIDSVPLVIGITIFVMIVVIISGIKHHQRGKDLYGYDDSDLFLDFDLSTGAGYAADHYSQRVTGPAYLVSQVALAGPLQIMKGIDRIRSRIKTSPGLERELERLLNEINSNDKWHPASDYSGRMQELGFLIKMHQIQFSPRKGRIRPL